MTKSMYNVVLVGTTINADLYCKSLNNLLKCSIRAMRRDNAVTRVYEKRHNACAFASITKVITSIDIFGSFNFPQNNTTDR